MLPLLLVVLLLVSLALMLRQWLFLLLLLVSQVTPDVLRWSISLHFFFVLSSQICWWLCCCWHCCWCWSCQWWKRGTSKTLVQSLKKAKLRLAWLLLSSSLVLVSTGLLATSKMSRAGCTITFNVINYNLFHKIWSNWPSSSTITQPVRIYIGDCKTLTSHSRHSDLALAWGKTLEGNS